LSLKLYMDVHVPLVIAKGLSPEIDVLTAQQDGSILLSDSDLMDRANMLGRVLVSQDEDMLREAALRQRGGQSFSGLIYAHQLGITIGQYIRDLKHLAETSDPENFVNRVEYLPLK